MQVIAITNNRFKMQAIRQVDNVHGEATVSFRLIEDLQRGGINVQDIKKLQEAGLTTIGSLLQCSNRELLHIKGLSEAKVDKIRETAKKLDSRGSQFKTGMEMREHRKQVIQITTGSQSLDRILVMGQVGGCPNQ